MIQILPTKFKTTGQTGYNGALEVMLTDEHGNEFRSYMTKDEMTVSNLLNKVADEKLRKELLNAIEDFGTERYSEGYDNCAYED